MISLSTNDLIRRAQAGDTKAEEALVLANEGLVYTQARGLPRYGVLVETEDLLQAGRIGLLKAIRRFDLSRKLQFSTCAVIWIRAGMRRLLKSRGRLIYIPENVLDQAGRQQAWLGLPEADLNLDAPSGDEGRTLLEQLADGQQIPVDEVCLAKLEAEELLKMIKGLPLHQRRAMYLHLGLAGGRELNLVESAKVLGITKEGVRIALVRASQRLTGEAEAGILPLVFQH
jgi:RNA polymerase sigma factor (sigma-70 family)